MGASKEALELFGITLTNDELQREIGTEAWAKIEQAGFVLVPMKWRDKACAALRTQAVACGPHCIVEHDAQCPTLAKPPCEYCTPPNKCATCAGERS